MNPDTVVRMGPEEVLESPGTRWSPVVPVVVVLLLVALGAGVWFVRRPPAGPLPPPDAPWPASGTATVYLCKENSALNTCGEDEATSAQRLAIERTLRGLPEVSAVRLKSRAEALEDFKASGMSDRLPWEVRETDMPESFAVNLTATGDFSRKVENMPGVSNIYVNGTNFWAGKTNVAVWLCPEKPVVKESRCVGRGAASASERTAVYQALSALDGVGPIYLEDRGHAAKNVMWVMETHPPGTTKPLPYIPETFHLLLDAPDAVARVERAVGHLPGVYDVGKETSH
ncbi:hypothetical protein Skr01_23070 [Sphaerisporangium krabiense]|nr:hypothetical protein Skr01_23070 [Sphaerisporangium krabiense]